MTGIELREAFINKLPVIFSCEGQPERRYKFIYRVIYCHLLGSHKIGVDVELVADDGSKRRESVDNVYIDTGDKPLNVINLNFQIPPKIMELFRNRSSVMVNEYPERRYEEINELELTRFPDDIQLYCLFYNRQYISRKINKPRRVPPESIVENFSSHPEYYYDLLDAKEYESENNTINPALQKFKAERTKEAKEKFHNFTEELRCRVNN